MTVESPSSSPRQYRQPFIYELLLFYLLLAGAYFRLNFEMDSQRKIHLVGTQWGESQWLHPDERFLLYVGGAIEPTKTVLIDPNHPELGTKQVWISLKEYFNTAQSTLNPANKGYTFFVYGTLPLFTTRFLADIVYHHKVGWDAIANVGRPLSAVSDLLVIVLVYLTASRLYNKRVGILAAAFYTAAVLPIQLSHYFKEDTYTNFFTFLAIYFAVMVATSKWKEARGKEARGKEQGAGSGSPMEDEVEGEWKEETEERWIGEAGEEADVNDASHPAPDISSGLQSTTWMTSFLPQFLFQPFFFLSIGFGFALGCAVASKVLSVPVAVMLPAAFAVRLLTVPVEERKRHWREALVYVGIAAVISLLVFRVFQPYAFNGPGFFGVRINKEWLQSILSQRTQYDFPPAMQWARRPVYFALKNLTVWGLGLPLGILAWAGFLWATWRIIKGNWRPHILLWGWTVGYYLFQWWQSHFNPTMRYFLPMYPTLVIFAAWGIVYLGSRFRIEGSLPDISSTLLSPQDRFLKLRRWLAIIVGTFVLIATFVYAYAFTQIYTRPITRLAASRWIYQNIPGPIVAHIETGEGLLNQPLPFPSESSIQPGQPYNATLVAHQDGVLQEVFLNHVSSQQTSVSQSLTLMLTVSALPNGEQPLAKAILPVGSTPQSDQGYKFYLDRQINLTRDQVVYLNLQLAEERGDVEVCGPLVLRIQTSGDMVDQMADGLDRCFVRADLPYNATLNPQNNGVLSEITLSNVTLLDAISSPTLITLTITGPEDQTAAATATLDPRPGSDPRGKGYTLTLDKPLPVKKGVYYTITLEVQPGGSAVKLQGDGLANEGEWDDGIPYPLDGYSFSGLYPPDLNFNMYWEDIPEKFERFSRILDASDYIAITSNRQWGSLPRMPERFPMTTLYYRNLLGCPAEHSIDWCYTVAEPGMFQGSLGFELVATFDSDPTIGPIRINDQFAEEAFTVYDHPKVFIFQKTAEYDSQKVRALLGSVDFTKVIHVFPNKAGSYPADLMLPADRLAEQRSGGTWSQLFNTEAIFNRSKPLGVVLWYVCVSLLGLIAYPLVRLALSGLPDHGYPLARTAGMLLLAWLVWIAGSVRIPYSRLTITVAIIIMILGGAVAAYFQRGELTEEWRTRRRYILMIELVALGFFLIDLFIRVGNPDLWHPFKGGEKPMDFSYFNAILKSTSFPPYDPWYAGGYLNYYYYGLYLVGVLVKWLGIVPSFAYNLILPTLFSMTALGTFSVAWNVYTKWSESRQEKTESGKPNDEGVAQSNAVSASENQSPGGENEAEIDPGDQSLTLNDDPGLGSPGLPFEESTNSGQGITSVESFPAPKRNSLVPATFYTLRSRLRTSPAFWIGLAAAIGMVVLGNLGTVGMIVNGYQRLGAPGGVTEHATLPTRIGWTIQGIGRVLKGAHMPYPPGEWYWIPSRIIPDQEGNSITEFPYFTFLYADMHPHMIAMPVALLALAWAVGIVFGRARWKGIGGFAVSFFLGGLAIGALYPINLSDTYTYLLLGIVAIGYTLWVSFDITRFKLLSGLPVFSKRLLITIGGIALLYILSKLLYQPYSAWYGQAYGSLEMWKGHRTPISSYLSHWGLFLFVIISWMAWETRDWMAHTPLSSLRKLEPYVGLIYTGLVVLLGVMAAQQLSVMNPSGSGVKWHGVSIIWLVLPLVAWAGILILRPGLLEAKRVTLFLIGTALMITLVVDIVVVKGDIGRMNTVFKFYLQAWTLFAVSGAVALGWLLLALKDWLPGWRIPWKIIFVALVVSAGLYTVIAGKDKISDRMAPDSPHTLDGMASYMPYSTYNEGGVNLDLSRDYRAIRWMQENIEGSPVMVEAYNGGSYRWFSRFVINTGLPDVVGWEWHQQQQRALLPAGWVTQRMREIGDFYQTTDPKLAEEFLRKYDVRYIIFGELEKVAYASPGLEKFASLDGVLWHRVYPPPGTPNPENETIIYEVIQP